MKQKYFHLFSIMKSNLAVNDERIANERTKLSLRMLRLIQFIVVGVQLLGLIVGVIKPHNGYFAVPMYIYFLILLPFIVEPLYACAKGSIGAQRYDAVFFLVGILEFGYFAMEAVRLFKVDLIWMIVALLLGMVLYYLACVFLYYLYMKRNISEE
ncbi:MAG: hypothetical protein GX802_00785 [Clostridiales bacterium]|nr:hypothetical protein [Clostridiales bacterium]